MKAETADYLAKARATLADAQQIAALPLPHVAAREAYLAAFHATFWRFGFERLDSVFVCLSQNTLDFDFFV